MWARETGLGCQVGDVGINQDELMEEGYRRKNGFGKKTMGDVFGYVQLELLRQ